METEDQKIKDELKNRTDDAYQKGIFGGYQAIMIKDGVYFGASESRRDGQASGY